MIFAASLSTGLARQGKRVLCLDANPQHSITVTFGMADPEKQSSALTKMITHIINEIDFDPTAGILNHSDGVDLILTDNTLAAVEIALTGFIGREMILKQYIEIIGNMNTRLFLGESEKTSAA